MSAKTTNLIRRIAGGLAVSGALGVYALAPGSTLASGSVDPSTYEWVSSTNEQNYAVHIVNETGGEATGWTIVAPSGETMTWCDAGGSTFDATSCTRTYAFHAGDPANINIVLTSPAPISGNWQIRIHTSGGDVTTTASLTMVGSEAPVRTARFRTALNASAVSTSHTYSISVENTGNSDINYVSIHAPSNLTFTGYVDLPAQFVSSTNYGYSNQIIPPGGTANYFITGMSSSSDSTGYWTVDVTFDASPLAASVLSNDNDLVVGAGAPEGGGGSGDSGLSAGLAPYLEAVTPASMVSAASPLAPLMIIGIIVGIGYLFLRWSVRNLPTSSYDKDQNAREKGFKDYDDYKRNA